MLTRKQVMEYSGHIKNPSSTRIKKVNEILEAKHKTKNFNTLSSSQIDYGAQLLNIPLAKLHEIHKHYRTKT